MKFYNNSILIDSSKKKILSTNLYCKYILRVFYKNQNTLKPFTIDNNSTFYLLDLNLKYFKKTFFRSINFNVGHSFALKTFFYKKKIFSSFFNFYSFNSQKKSFINYYIEKLYSLKSKKKSFFLIRVKKGGFICLFNGIKGFLPRSHGIYLIKKIKCILNFKNGSLNDDIFLITKLLKEKNILNLRKINTNLIMLTTSLSNSKIFDLKFFSCFFYVKKKNLFIFSKFTKFIPSYECTNLLLKKNHNLVSLLNNNFNFVKCLHSFIYFNIQLSNTPLQFRKKLLEIKKNKKFINRYSCIFIFLAFLN